MSFHESVGADEAATTAEFITFLKDASRKRHPNGTIRRFNQARQTACVDAEFTVLDNLAPPLRVGLFAEPRTYAATIRFANAATQSDRERDTRGMSIKVLGVGGANLTPTQTAQDFVLNSHPVMMVADTREFLELLQANEAGGWRRALYFLSHPKAIRIALASRGTPSSHLAIPYWSTTPYAYGDRVVKYITRPVSPPSAAPPATLTDTYLYDAMRTRLATQDAEFDFLVQFQTDAKRMPVEDASVEWKESDSPYVPVARVRIPKQTVEAPERAARGEHISFNPWHALEAHKPLGNMNRARREIYAVMAAFREAPRA